MKERANLITRLAMGAILLNGCGNGNVDTAFPVTNENEDFKAMQDVAKKFGQAVLDKKTQEAMGYLKSTSPEADQAIRAYNCPTETELRVSKVEIIPPPLNSWATGVIFNKTCDLKNAPPGFTQSGTTNFIAIYFRSPKDRKISDFSSR